MSSVPLSDDEFVGYTFTHPPERRPRLWFLDRQLHPLTLGTIHAVTVDNETGLWTAEYPPLLHTADLLPIPDIHLRYEHLGPKPWTAVWKLTHTLIPHVHTFGRDDTWRLAVWPD
jgi:hypothetical protein